MRKSTFLSLLLSFALILILPACSGGRSSKTRLPQPPPEPKVEEPREVRQVPIAPWKVWESDSLDSADLLRGDELVVEGKLEEAANAYSQLVRSPAVSEEFQLEAMLRQLGTLLKMGKSQRVLTEAWRFLKSRGLHPGSADARLCFIVAHAYIEKGNLNQAFAWLRLAHGASVPQSRLEPRRVRNASLLLIKGLPEGEFNSFSQRWSADPFLGALYARERLRRSKGGRPGRSFPRYYFKADTYVRGLLVRSESSSPFLQNRVVTGAVVGVLLPLTGQYSNHAERVRQGIDLALEELGFDLGTQVVYGDTRGMDDVAALEYEKLVRRDGAAIVLGPLLFKSTEAVSARSQELGVPFITFTKRPGVPALGRTVYRLGVTPENQIEELLYYSSREMFIKSYGILYPNTPSGFEFATLFRDALEGAGKRVIQESAYEPGDQVGIKQILDTWSLNPPEAIFIPDALDSAFPVLTALRHKEEILDESSGDIIGYEDYFKDSIVLGTALWNDPISIRGYGQLLEGAVYVTPFFEQSERVEIANFIQTFKDRYNVSPDLLSAQAYDGARLAASVLAAKNETQEVLDRLNAINDFPGVTGSLSVRSSGEVTRRMSVLRFHRGEVLEVMAGGIGMDQFRVVEKEEEKEEEVDYSLDPL